MMVNHGFLQLSDYRKDQPTVICGSGRSGTTAFALWVVNSGHFPFVADASDFYTTLEIHGLNEAVARGDHKLVAKFRNRTQANYSPSFFFKCPTFEVRAMKSPFLADVWGEANMVLMMRDPVAVACREKSVANPTRNFTKEVHVERAVQRLHATVNAAVHLSNAMGVALVSYEKMITNGSDIAAHFNEWVGVEGLLQTAWSRSVTPNASGYRKKIEGDIEAILKLPSP
jgi:hypothetical protein